MRHQTDAPCYTMLNSSLYPPDSSSFSHFLFPVPPPVRPPSQNDTLSWPPSANRMGNKVRATRPLLC
uniref:Uncharacterized protein n=1 Tax=Caenorhabditis japonica TaxID=281687 RepID=A0A8R1EA58_CAEJA